MSERMIPRDGTEIWSEGIGNSNHPTVLLIMGATAQAIIWPEPLINRIVSSQRHVIRYDHRDVGRSTCHEYKENPYTLDDLADDARAVLDGWGVETAHVVGVSMGGMIAQLLMINSPERLTGATLISTSPLAGSLESGDLHRGPFLEAMDRSGPMQRPTNKHEWLAQQIQFFTAMADPAVLDPKLLEHTLSQAYDRASNVATASNHALAIGISTPVDRRALLNECDTPTTVLHGYQDPVLPLSHGQAVADAIPDARFVVFDKMRHDLPEYCWDAIVDSLSHSHGIAG